MRGLFGSCELGSDLEFRVGGLGLGLRVRVLGSGFRVGGFGFGV